MKHFLTIVFLLVLGIWAHGHLDDKITEAQLSSDIRVSNLSLDIYEARRALKLMTDMEIKF